MASAPGQPVVSLTDRWEEPVVAVAEAVAPSVVLVIVPGTAQGSGIVLDNDGRVVTNAHVVNEYEEVQILLPSGQLVEGAVLGADVRRDVAVVQLAETDERSGAHQHHRRRHEKADQEQRFAHGGQKTDQTCQGRVFRDEGQNRIKKFGHGVGRVGREK